MRNVILFACLAFTAEVYAEESTYGNKLGDLSGPIVTRLAEHVAPNGDGAMGRNRRGYFHVRFQLGMHHLVDYGLVKKLPRAVERFLDAAEYSLRYQQEDGSFSVVIPSELKGFGVPSQTDQASGVAFFISSLGSGIYALESNDWFGASNECTELVERLAKVKEQLPRTLAYLLKHRGRLKLADRNAPNRLLFNGLAFYSLGRILESDKAIVVASEFIALATQQVHDEGYFIEGGGFDSSYNGVAVALGFRLLMMGYSRDNLDSICRKALKWQQGRVADTGEIRTDGNTRVNPGGDGESFLGRTKDVDVAHTIEALILAALYTDGAEYKELASKVFAFYRKDHR